MSLALPKTIFISNKVEKGHSIYSRIMSCKEQEKKITVFVLKKEMKSNLPFLFTFTLNIFLFLVKKSSIFRSLAFLICGIFFFTLFVMCSYSRFHITFPMNEILKKEYEYEYHNHSLFRSYSQHSCVNITTESIFVQIKESQRNKRKFVDDFF